MALLPHELRALRLRQLLLAVLGLGLVAVAIVFSLTRDQLSAMASGAPSSEAAWADPASEGRDAAAGKASQREAPRDDAPAPAATDDSTNALAAELPARTEATGGSGPLTRVARPFGKARGFRDALVTAGAAGHEADALISALEGLVDFRLGQPEHQLIFERDGQGTLQGFEYRAGITERYRADRGSDGGYSGSRIKVEIEQRRVARGGYVSDSLGRALESLGLRNSLAGAFVEAFEGKIDFKRDVREGDSFRVVLEEEYAEGQLLGYAQIQAVQYNGARSGETRAFWFDAGSDGGGDFYDRTGRALHGGWLRTPLRYDHISSGYNLKRRHPILKRIVPHHGVDYAAPSGTLVWAAADGVVTFAGRRGANGNLVALKHHGGYETYYAHLLRTARGMKRGTRVRQRQTIGAVGSTGRSTGPHLHFALKRNGRFIDPATQLNGPGKPLPASLMPRFKRHVAQLERELAAIQLAAAPEPAAEPTTAPAAEELPEDPIDL